MDKNALVKYCIHSPLFKYIFFFILISNKNPYFLRLHVIKKLIVLRQSQSKQPFLNTKEWLLNEYNILFS